jgi:hypothetical protein
MHVCIEVSQAPIAAFFVFFFFALSLFCFFSLPLLAAAFLRLICLVSESSTSSQKIVFLLFILGNLVEARLHAKIIADVKPVTPPRSHTPPPLLSHTLSLLHGHPCRCFSRVCLSSASETSRWLVSVALILHRSQPHAGMQATIHC